MKKFPAPYATVVALLLTVFLSACTGNKNSETPPAEDSVAEAETNVPTETETASVDSTAGTPYTGTFEYSEPWEGGYIYYKIELVQEGKTVTGKFNAGNYLASNGSGYTAPDALMEGDIDGYMQKQDGKDYMAIRFNVTKEEQLEEDAPSLKELMNFPDMEVEVDAVIWNFQFENGVLKSANGHMEGDHEEWLEWEKLEEH